MLQLIARRFQLDLNRGANLTQQSLLELTLDSYTAEALAKFIERIELVLNSIPLSHQPSEMTKFTWLFSRLKHCRTMQRFIDRIKDARDGSHVRTWDWLYGKFKAVVIELREDANEESVRRALSPEKPKPRANPKVMVRVKLSQLRVNLVPMIKRHKVLCLILQPSPKQSRRLVAQRVVGKVRKEVHRIRQSLVITQRVKLLLEIQVRRLSQRLSRPSPRLSVCFTRIAIEVAAVRFRMQEHQKPRRSQRLRQQRHMPRQQWPRCSLAVFEEPRHQEPTCHLRAKPSRCSCILSKHSSHPSLHSRLL